MRERELGQQTEEVTATLETLRHPPRHPPSLHTHRHFLVCHWQRGVGMVDYTITVVETSTYLTVDKL